MGSRNYTKSLSGIETTWLTENDSFRYAAITLNPYQGLKPITDWYRRGGVGRNYTKSLSGIETTTPRSATNSKSRNYTKSLSGIETLIKPESDDFS